MHVSSLSSPLSPDPNSISISISWNWNWFFQFVLTAFIVTLGLLYILRTVASKLFLVETSFHSSSSSSLSSSATMGAASNGDGDIDSCAICAKPTSKQCSGCKAVKYCSQICQSEHWRSGHKLKCKDLKLSAKVKSIQSPGSGKRSLSVALVPSSGADKTQKLVDKVLYPYDEFVKLFNWDREIFPPRGLLNCGNSCFANVILQCLAHTRPLLAYLLDKGHRRDCKRNEWCFLCELQTHMERASRSQQAFSPINILSRLPSIGGNLGYGRQEDAHEFMRFAIDTMQSVCLDEYGGEKVIHPKSQETTLIQHIFGGQLQSQVICTKCNQVSNQYDNMMDLTVEIQGDATSLEECLDQFTAKEWLHGENMYKCDGCNDYVRAWKRLSIHQAPNILTIALKRFQSGRFGKINKRITFPESLDLTPYTSEGRDGTDKYKLYAVVVHVDMLNASFFGHYICYTKGFQGDWYRIDDCKVTGVELEEVLSQGAYMLLYSRVSARPACLKTFESASQQQLQETDKGASVPKGIRVSDTSNSSKPSNSNCSSSHAHLISNYNHRQLGQTDTQKEQLSRADPQSVNGSQVGSHTVNHFSVEANGHDTSNALMLCDDRDNGIVLGRPNNHHYPNEQSSIILPLSNGSSASSENTDENVIVNGFPPESNGKLQGEDKSEDEPQVACDGERENSCGVKGDTQEEVPVYINSNGCGEFSQERRDNMKCADEMDVDIRPGSDDMDVDDLEVNNHYCVSNGHSEH